MFVVEKQLPETGLLYLQYFQSQYPYNAKQIKKIPPNKPCASDECLHTQHLNRKVVRKTKLRLQKISRVDFLGYLVSVQSKDNKRRAIFEENSFWLKIASWEYKLNPVEKGFLEETLGWTS